MDLVIYYEFSRWIKETNERNEITKDFLTKDDKVLLIDDFLANGCALLGLKAICDEAGAEVKGAGIVIEKAYQGGGDKLRAQGVRVESLAMIESMEDGKIVFRK